VDVFSGGRVDRGESAIINRDHPKMVVGGAADGLDESTEVPSRNDPETLTCPVCAAVFAPVGRQRYCSPACRQAGWRERRGIPATEPVVVPAGASRRTITVYECPGCDSRFLGQQWCYDCGRPCIRVDLGGLCPHRNEPITIRDITDQHPEPR
jgi:uncharacterized C2H2 Zn-finger protein